MCKHNKVMTKWRATSFQKLKLLFCNVFLEAVINFDDEI